MSFTITERDKKLLILVSCALVILVCVRYLIMPALENRQELDMQIEELSQRKQEWEGQLTVLNYVDKAIEDNEATKAEASEEYFELLETRQMDRKITNMALSHGLFPQSLSLNEAEPGSVDKYLYYEAEDETLIVDPEYVYIGTVTFEVEGQTEQWMEFVDDINDNEPGMRVTSFEIERRDYVDENKQTITTYGIVSTLDIYMCAEGEGAAE